MTPLRALSFRRFTLPSVADLVWARQVRAQLRPSREQRREMHMKRPTDTSRLRLRLEMINTMPRQVCPRKAKGR